MPEEVKKCPTEFTKELKQIFDDIQEEKEIKKFMRKHFIFNAKMKRQLNKFNLVQLRKLSTLTIQKLEACGDPEAVFEC
mgnify:CR=1 FL=1|jgi:hypothetical protein|tara:strand:- start:455 stop:691 length:237 start_codon:yes stop_codon:yes gene_type:complete